jgi:branched-chain amino acid transport system substrate-binding protein
LRPDNTGRTISRSTLALATALAAVLAFAGCTSPEPEQTIAPVDRQPLTLKIGTLLPVTGALAAFGPPALAAAQLAVDDIAAADAGITVQLESRDSGDASAGTAVTSVDELLATDPSVIVGPISDNVARKVVDTIVGAGVVQISPGTTGADFTRIADDDLYWRTAPSCALEGTVLGSRLAERGATTLGIVYQRDFCEGALFTAVQVAFEAAGGRVVSSQSFDATAGALTTEVAAIVAEHPDAVAVLTPSKAGLAVNELVAAGYSGDQLGFVGLSITDHSGDLPAGSIVGSIATMPGVDISELGDFTDRLLDVDPALTDFSYAAETYDAVVLAALAALQANSTKPADIAGALRAVSGGEGGGEVATTFASAADIILAGGSADYDGFSGAIAFNADGDPLGAIIRVYEYQDDNTWTRLDR